MAHEREDPLAAVERAAALARLELDADLRARMASDFGRILEAWTSLAGLDLEGVEPLLSPGVATEREREDRVLPSLERTDLLAPAPQAEDGFFAVPKTLGGER
jgi:aspartyl-tRNA(Asn)/glutamyl-tRNA(Gln) amidotransferase subunit C